MRSRDVKGKRLENTDNTCEELMGRGKQERGRK